MKTAPVALLFPIYNEDPARFFSGIEVMYEALEEAGMIEHFTFFVLSDSTDPNRWVEEEESYEELPQTLLDFAQRDRRWCQGNLQHAWIAFFGRIPFFSRVHMLNGIYAYLAAPLWLLFLGVSTLIAYSWESSGLTLLARPNVLPISPDSLPIHGLTVLLWYPP